MKRHAAKLLSIGIPLFALGFWIAFYSAPVSGLDSPTARLQFALGCSAAAALLTLALGVEAVARDRLFSKAIDPLSGFESHRLKVNRQYLQNTLEQFVLFAIGLLSLATLLQDASQMRLVAALTTVWILSRFVFWIGYHHDPLDRIYGLIGMMQSLMVLIYVTFEFARAFFGLPLALTALAVFLFTEAVLTYRSSRQK